MSEKKLTPMMKQWAQAKEQHKDAILLFRMGDFYELFGDDAINAAPILDLNITSRDKDKSGLKMAGFPAHSAESYIQKLVDSSYKVAICEQLEDPKTTKGLVKRGITEVVTPGTRLESEESFDVDFSFLAALNFANDFISLSALDLKTGTFISTCANEQNKIADELSRLSPKELIVSDQDNKAYNFVSNLKNTLPTLRHCRVEKRPKTSVSYLDPRLKKIKNAVGINEWSSVCLIWDYVTFLRGTVPAYIRAPKTYSITNSLLMDASTIANLDILPKNKGDEGNLFSLLNEAKTAMGKRMLKKWLASPSTDIDHIREQQSLVNEFFQNNQLRSKFREEIHKCFDIEKLTALASAKKIGPRGMARLRDCLQVLNTIKTILKKHEAQKSLSLFKFLPSVEEIRELLDKSMSHLPPINLKDGGAFKKGFNKELDKCVRLSEEGQELLLQLESKERKKHDIPNLKVRYTRVFGYYIEVSKSYLKKVPNYYQRKQTVANGERYITNELSELEIQINEAKEKKIALEQELFETLRSSISEQSHALMSIGQALGRLDVLVAFAKIAVEKNFVRPVLSPKETKSLEIKAGRHPVIEELCKKSGSYFVANDFDLNHNECAIALITGPNMAGKSTVMRQVALIQIMAQIGSFVPASTAKLSICDAIFARVGAFDDLSQGKSTFMVEMSETAYILANASVHSLVLLDEIGRGTSTYDGMAIAQSVVEYIHNTLKCRTIFATHYHELTELEKSLKLFKNFHVEVDENDENISFLYTITRGPAQKSFGVQVAKLAGLPSYVLNRAEKVLDSLENASTNHGDNIKPDNFSMMPRPQLSLFNKANNHGGFSPINPDIDKLLSVNINHTTPLEALNTLARIQKRLKKNINRENLS